MTKYYVLKVRGTWLGEKEFSISPRGLDAAYCIGPDEVAGMAITRNQHEALRYTRRVVRDVKSHGGLGDAAYYFVGLSTKATRLKKRAQNSLLNEGEDGTVYLHLKPNTWHSVEADIVLDVLAEAGF